MKNIYFIISLVQIITTCYGNVLPHYNESVVFNNNNTNNENSIINDNSYLQNVRIYDYGIPSNLQELYDIQNGNLIPMAKVKYINYKQFPDLKNVKGKNIVSQKAFNFNIKSEKSHESEIYEKALLRAEDVISKALEIKKTINVDVYIEDFCNSIQSIQCASLVGMTYAPIYIALKDGPNEREYAYPQALAKQLNLDKEIEFSGHDLIVYLNTKMAKEDYSDLIVTHEILHGLGIMGNGVVIGKSIGMDQMAEELFSPYVYYDFEKDGDEYKYHLLGFLPFTIYEKYIVSLKEPDTYICRTGFDEFYNKSVNITSYLLNTKSSTTDQFSVLTDIYKNIYDNNSSIDKYRKIAKLYKTHNSIGFKSSDGEVITLQTFDDKYLSSSSICHISVPFECHDFVSCSSENMNDYDNEFLMYYSYPIQFKTTDMINRFNNKYSLIGPKLMKILTTMGWTEKGTTQNEKIYYVTNDQYPDVYNNLFKVKANNKLYDTNKKEPYLISKGITIDSHFISIMIIIILSLIIVYY
ncbi:hypothetical protein BCR36DRAFT_412442 [Piromyces finnis]|uniref:Uncharacterized protein n=1 Tax=Piromyces finnis TaxID=1754191 RepID=A0A1Y1V9F1_9FUNG|nr:hypothetical protein BCR36DRAFT_412442 [Piromyces finnis]|eukprot:ORX50417.1 hypothetical protein BCR36DRAFT_412442 [Piromyces finnis]